MDMQYLTRINRKKQITNHKKANNIQRPKRKIKNKEELLNIQNIVLVIEIWNFEFIWNLVLGFCFFAIKYTKFKIKVLKR